MIKRERGVKGVGEIVIPVGVKFVNARDRQHRGSSDACDTDILDRILDQLRVTISLLTALVKVAVHKEGPFFPQTRRDMRYVSETRIQCYHLI